MGTVLASKIAADAGKLLFDTGYDRISEADHLNFINAGQIQAAIIKPDISVSNAAKIMVAGTKQTISSTGISFIKLTRNMGTDGTTPGKTIEFVDMDLFGRRNKDWNTATASATIKLYAFNPRDPRNFYVYPPQPASGFGYAEQVECVMPTAIAPIGSAINIDDIYETALFHYDLYRGFSIDAKHSEGASRKAMFHYGLFVQILTGKEITETQAEPEV